MAKITYSGIGITEASGSTGQTVHSRNRGGHFTRNRTIPVNTLTPRRTNFRSIFAVLNVFWQSLSDSERAQWNAYSLTIVEKNQLGNEFRPSGYNYFCQVNWLNVITSSPATTLPPENTKPIFPSVITPQPFTTSSMSFVGMMANDTVFSGSNELLFFSATDCMSPGIHYCTTRFRLLSAAGPPYDLSFFDLFSFWNAEYGTPIVGKKVFWKFYSINITSGAKSPPIIVSGIIN